MSAEAVPVLIVSGPVGVGKTSTAHALSGLLVERGMRHALIDLPQIGMLAPPREDDFWNDEVTHRNLACMWRNFRDAGAERLVLSRVLEYRTGIEHIENAVPGAQVTVVRLRAPLKVIHARIRGRNHSDPQWFLDAATHLSRSMDETAIEDHLLENSSLSIEETARQILELIGWVEPTGEKRDRRT